MTNGHKHAWQWVFVIGAAVTIAAYGAQLLGWFGGTAGSEAAYRQRVQSHIEGFQSSDTALWAELAKYRDMRERVVVLEEQVRTLKQQRTDDHVESVRWFNQIQGEIKEARAEVREALRGRSP